MSRISRVLLILLLSFGFLIRFPQTVLADSYCAFQFLTSDVSSEIIPNQNMGTITVLIHSDELKSSTYRLVVKVNNSLLVERRDIQFTSPEVRIQLPAPYAELGWPAGTYRFDFIDQNQSVNKCATFGTFTLNDITISSPCITTIVEQPIDPDTVIHLKISQISHIIPGENRIFINNTYAEPYSHTGTGDSDTIKLCQGGTQDENCKFSVGTYTVTIRRACPLAETNCPLDPLWPQRLQCTPIAFTVGPKGSDTGGQLPPGSNIIPPPCAGQGSDCSSAGGQPCSSSDLTNPGIITAIGCIHTNPVAFVKDFMTFIIGISGGLAFLMMLLGAFQMLTSAGNPETLNAGRERLTSAVIGLLFVIFAVLLLQIIGFGILKIPGFG